MADSVSENDRPLRCSGCLSWWPRAFLVPFLHSMAAAWLVPLPAVACRGTDAHYRTAIASRPLYRAGSGCHLNGGGAVCAATLALVLMGIRRLRSSITAYAAAFLTLQRLLPSSHLYLRRSAAAALSENVKAGGGMPLGGRRWAVAKGGGWRRRRAGRARRRLAK